MYVWVWGVRVTVGGWVCVAVNLGLSLAMEETGSTLVTDYYIGQPFYVQEPSVRQW